MTARKPKPRKAAVRKGLKPTLGKRVFDLEEWAIAHSEWATRKTENDNGNNDVLRDVLRRLDALETRKHFRDASHDEPVSNAGEAVGQHFTILSESLVKVPTKHGGWRWAWWRP